MPLRQFTTNDDTRIGLLPYYFEDNLPPVTGEAPGETNRVDLIRRGAGFKKEHFPGLRIWIVFAEYRKAISWGCQICRV